MRVSKQQPYQNVAFFAHKHARGWRLRCVVYNTKTKESIVFENTSDFLLECTATLIAEQFDILAGSNNPPLLTRAYDWLQLSQKD